MRYGRSNFAELAYRMKLPKLMLTINSRFILKKDVQPDVLLQAIRDCLKLYPLFGCTFEQEGDKFYFVDNDAPLSLYETDKFIFPDGKRLNGYLFFVGYSGRTVSISVDHRLSDGSGVQRFFGTVFRRYGDLLNGSAEEITGPAYDVSLMYQQTPTIPAGDHREYQPFACEGEVIRLPGMTEEKPYRSFTCRADESVFMDYTRKHETTALAAISQITGKGIFALYPEKGDFVRMLFVMNMKKALGLERSFTNMLEHGMVDISRKEADDPACLKRMCADIKGQIADENIFYQKLYAKENRLFDLRTHASYVCSYLRADGMSDGVVESHQSVPLCFDPIPKLDVRACGGCMEFTVTGSPQCEVLYNAVKIGLAETGIPILGETRQTFEVETDRVSILE